MLEHAASETSSQKLYKAHEVKMEGVRNVTRVAEVSSKPFTYQSLVLYLDSLNLSSMAYVLRFAQRYAIYVQTNKKACDTLLTYDWTDMVRILKVRTNKTR